MKTSSTITLICAIFLLNEVKAQTCCTGSAPITGAVNVSPLTNEEWQISLSYDYNNIADLIQDNTVLNDDYITRTTTTLLLQGAYGFGGGFGVSILFPVVNHTEIIRGNINTTSKNTDPGDITVFGQYALPLKHSATLLMGLALKLPTGTTQATGDSPFVLQPTLQAGTGSFDYIFLVQGQKSMAFRKSMIIQQSLTYRINTLSTRFASHDNYRFGNEFFAITSVADQLVTGSLVHTPSLSLNIRYAGKNTIEDFIDPNSGGWWFNLRPGWGINLTSGINLSVLYELPVYRNLNGFQLTTSYKIIGVITIKL